MRIVSYNILEGGIGRADPIAEVLLAQRADVVGLVEADDPEILDRIAWRLGVEYIAAAGPEGRASALLTRGRILESVNHALLIGASGPRSFLEATVEIDHVVLPLGVIHLTAQATQERERIRETELAEALHVFRERRAHGEPHVLMGDFNANSPVQEIIPERLKPSSREALGANGGDLPRRVVRTLLDAGYVDTLAAHDPEAAAVVGSFTTLHPGQRVEYIFTFGSTRVDAAWVETDRLAKYASDHYPVGCELSFSGPGG